MAEYHYPSSPEYRRGTAIVVMILVSALAGMIWMLNQSSASAQRRKAAEEQERLDRMEVQNKQYARDVLSKIFYFQDRHTKICFVCIRRSEDDPNPEIKVVEYEKVKDYLLDLSEEGEP